MLMRDENRAARQEKIEEAAYAVLEAKGYAGTSMLAIARAARASNETLYNWYGDKTGLFKALVVRNAEEVRTLLLEGLDSEESPLDILRALGPRLLELLLSAPAPSSSTAPPPPIRPGSLARSSPSGAGRRSAR
jgi:AcrR family transcriptional regulator